MSGLAHEDHFAREALQASLLGSIFTTKLSRMLVLKGGLAMRAAHGVSRMTKDIDLDCDHDNPMEMVRTLVRKAIKSSLHDDLICDATITEPKMTDTTMRWKINGKAPGTESLIHLTVEISRREVRHELKTETIPANFEHHHPLVKVYQGDALAWLKTNALLADNRAAPRDLFDLDVLVKAGVEPPMELLQEKTIEELEEMIAKTWAKIEILNWDLAKAELVPFMVSEVAAKMDRELWEEMQLSVGTGMEQWFKKAIEHKKGMHR